MNALGGIRACIDPTIMTASRTIGAHHYRSHDPR